MGDRGGLRGGWGGSGWEFGGAGEGCRAGEFWEEGCGAKEQFWGGRHGVWGAEEG